MGLPSWKRACGRSVNTTHDRSAGTSMLSATSPYCEKGSSSEATVSVSNTPPRPVAGTPLRTNGFRVSKVPMAASLTLPYFGASGLTYWKWVKPGGYLRSPCIEIPGPVVTFSPPVCGAAGPTHPRKRRSERSRGPIHLMDPPPRGAAVMSLPLRLQKPGYFGVAGGAPGAPAAGDSGAGAAGAGTDAGTTDWAREESFARL